MQRTDPAVLNAADRTRLAKMLGLLSSDKAGERDAAAHAATRFLRARSLQWGDVLAAQTVTQTDRLKPWPPPTSHLLDRWPEHWKEAARLCAERGLASGFLTQWEEEFVEGLRRFPELSRKQLKVLRRLTGVLIEAGVMS